MLQLPGDDPAPADRIAGIRERLLAARTARPAPGRDDKVVAAWNGLAIAALAETGAYFDRPDLVGPPRAPPTCWCGSTWTSTAGWPAPRGTAWPAPTRGCWRTTRTSPRASSRWPR